MNERIEELRVQALRWAGENVNRNLYSDYEIHLKEYERFAELIVRECVRHFNEDYQRDFDTLWRDDLSKSIKQHFGVE